MIDGLKSVAQEYFHHNMKTDFRPEWFAEVTKEVYSNRANYKVLRCSLLAAAMKNMSVLQNATVPVLDRELLVSVPGFMEDLCLAFILKYGHRKCERDQQ